MTHSQEILSKLDIDYRVILSMDGREFKETHEPNWIFEYRDLPIDTIFDRLKVCNEKGGYGFTENDLREIGILFKSNTRTRIVARYLACIYSVKEFNSYLPQTDPQNTIPYFHRMVEVLSGYHLREQPMVEMVGDYNPPFLINMR